MTFRPYRAETDRDAVRRIWREVGWIDGEGQEKALDVFLEGGRNLLADLNGEPECMVNTNPGVLVYQNEEIPLSCVTGVTTSRVARKRGMAIDLTAHALGEDAVDGAAVAMLGVFEQGFYNRLGFGNGCYEHWCTLDPTRLSVDVTARTPRRLTADDWETVHASRLERRRRHGACSILSPELTRAEMMWGDNGFGLGYVGDAGDLTHHIWCTTTKADGGPYRIEWMVYRDRLQFLELLALIRTLGDQVRSIRMREPGGIQLQDLLAEPFKLRQVTQKSPHENRMNASAYWQARILDLPRCIRATHLDSGSISFNLVLDDPIKVVLPEDRPWRGIGGEYRIALGSESSASRGSDPAIPTLRASVGAFTRMWLGVRSATGLSWTDAIEGPPELLRELDRTLRLPSPSPDWDF